MGFIENYNEEWGLSGQERADMIAQLLEFQIRQINKGIEYDNTGACIAMLLELPDHTGEYINAVIRTSLDRNINTVTGIMEAVLSDLHHRGFILPLSGPSTNFMDIPGTQLPN